MPNTAAALKQITVNGQPQAVVADTLSELVAALDLDVRKVAIEHNLSIVPRSQYGSTPLQQGDSIEIVGFIGGG